jgi:hypothetical protein
MPKRGCTYLGSWDEDPSLLPTAFVISYGKVLGRGSKEHKHAIVEAQKNGDQKEVRKLLAELPANKGSYQKQLAPKIST